MYLWQLARIDEAGTRRRFYVNWPGSAGGSTESSELAEHSDPYNSIIDPHIHHSSENNNISDLIDLNNGLELGDLDILS